MLIGGGAFWSLMQIKLMLLPQQHILHRGWRILIPHEDKVDVINPVNILFIGGGGFWSLMTVKMMIMMMVMLIMMMMMLMMTVMMRMIVIDYDNVLWQLLFGRNSSWVLSAKTVESTSKDPEVIHCPPNAIAPFWATTQVSWKPGSCHKTRPCSSMVLAKKSCGLGWYGSRRSALSPNMRNCENFSGINLYH